MASSQSPTHTPAGLAGAGWPGPRRSCGSELGDLRRPRPAAAVIPVLVAGIAVLAGCGANSGYHQAVSGTFVRVGGPAPGSPVPLPGTITARDAAGGTFTATAGRNGRFSLSLPPGTYRVTGRSPLMQSGQMICAATAGLHVSRGKPARPVTVVCSIP